MTSPEGHLHYALEDERARPRPTPPDPTEHAEGLKAWEVGNYGVDKVYSGGVKWAVRRNDIDSYMVAESEAQAREWYEADRSHAEKVLPDNPEIWPELVAARIHWIVQE